MVSDQEVKEKLQEAQAFVNGNPEQRTQDYLIIQEQEPEEEDDNENEEVVYEINEIPLHDPVHTELNGILVGELYEMVRDVANKETKPVEAYSIGTPSESNPLEYLETEDVPEFGRFEDMFQRADFKETPFQESTDPEFQAIRIKDQWGSFFIGFRKYTSGQVVGTSKKLKVLLLIGQA